MLSRAQAAQVRAIVEDAIRSAGLEQAFWQAAPAQYRPQGQGATAQEVNHQETEAQPPL